MKKLAALALFGALSLSLAAAGPAPDSKTAKSPAAQTSTGAETSSHKVKKHRTKKHEKTSGTSSSMSPRK